MRVNRQQYTNLIILALIMLLFAVLLVVSALANDQPRWWVSVHYGGDAVRLGCSSSPATDNAFGDVVPDKPVKLKVSAPTTYEKDGVIRRLLTGVQAVVDPSSVAERQPMAIYDVDDLPTDAIEKLLSVDDDGSHVRLALGFRLNSKQAEELLPIDRFGKKFRTSSDPFVLSPVKLTQDVGDFARMAVKQGTGNESRAFLKELSATVVGASLDTLGDGEPWKNAGIVEQLCNVLSDAPDTTKYVVAVSKPIKGVDAVAVRASTEGYIWPVDGDDPK